MKKLITIALLILLIIIFIFIGKNDSKNNKSVEPISFNDLGIRGANKQQSRFEWEFNRLKNPQSGNIPRNIRQKELEFAKSRFQKYSINYRNLNWIHRGPYNVGGRTRGAAIDVTNDNVILSGAVSGGLWRTTDGGENWNKITTADQLHSVSCLVQDKRNGKTNIWYYGTGEGSGNSASAPGAFYAGNGMYKSIDGGLTWNLLAETSSGNLSFDALWDVIWNIAIDNSNNTSDIVYAATLGAIYKSSDGGDSWNKQLGGSTSAFAYYTNVITTPKGVVYAVLSDDGPDNGIWRSQDGETWYNILPDSFPEGFERIVIAINPQNENSIYFLAHTPENGKLGLGYKGTEDWNSLWKYTFVKNNGLGNDGVWQNLSENIPAKAKKGFDDFNAQGSYNLVIKFKPNDSNILFIGGTNLYRSTDGFTSSNNTKQIGGYGVGTKRPNWAVYENHHPDQHEIDFLATDPNVLINFNDGGVFKTNDCMADTVKWTSLNNGYLTTQLYTVNFEKEATNDILIAGFQDNGNYFVNSDNEKASWTMPLNGDGSYSAIAPDREFYIFSTQLGKMAKMTLDNDGNRTAFARIDPIGGKNYQFINPFVIDPNDKNILYLP
ncbi:MAG: sialidase family protein, partial [Bacteroidota bacterium]|nr:sialidase family protein [Bacteroidota bacterium]